MTTGRLLQTRARPDARRRLLRRTAVGLTAVLAMLYMALFLLVMDAERGLSENTFGAYLFLSITYLVGVGALVLRDHRLVYAAGAVVQVAVLVLFVVFAVGGEHEGVFEYDALAGLHMAIWAAAITGAQVVLLGLLSYLAAVAPADRPAGTTG